MTSPRIAWTEPSRTGDRLLLVVDLRPVAAFAVGAGLLVVPLLAAPLGRLSTPFALVIVLPTLALALEVAGWRDWLAVRLARIRRPLPRLLGAYVTWLATSAVLTLDVAAVAAASVGIAVAGDARHERREQLGAAILGANVGSLLLPFSNLTNLVLVAATGIGFAAYVGLAVLPQLAAALAVALLICARARRSSDDVDDDAQSTLADGRTPSRLPRPATWTGIVALVGAAGAVAAGLVGADMAVPFASSAAILAGFAIGSGRVTVRQVAAGIPMSALAVIVGAALLTGPFSAVAAALPRPDASIPALLAITIAGGVLAALANNLPAAAAGAVWLGRAHPAAIVAFLIGTNVAAIATPHGSVATMLARRVGARHGVSGSSATYLRWGVPYALIGSVAALVALCLVAHRG